ncbi:cap-specific mRNA (nucleoside-2'-O-)-methyltransferase 1 [Diachasma alloeum]|uniref:cap-specific mRNA (nucleoside-2'-O-)-methyltransferase 1 n=1 Tax=Diachasma alloeum TaxID=454923 RepID=UPI000738169D|nr:cap-specific mRNA (nucleoside-2'-O-)-methyltransferase 1 [Diachasma alloeum]XP_015110561.1 cap-specific mRNA (nucleoside-2'-O-)-methyltransferase 1 [Diachasma alloeum]
MSIMESRLSETSDSETDDRPSFGGPASLKRPYDYLSTPDDDLTPSFDNPQDFSKRRKFEDPPSNPPTDPEDDSPPEDFPRSTKKSTNPGLRMMENMGYNKGQGLGKKKDGIREPIQAFRQKGRRGLGHDNKPLAQAVQKWNPSDEIVKVKEEMAWIVNDEEPPTSDDLKDWLLRGPRKETIDDETLFCEPQILHEVINSKSIFDGLPKQEMQKARTRSNPYETIRGAFFLNRAAVKMANIDKACDFMFTQPKGSSTNDILYFADVCAGPGGFSEYILWRRKWHAKGFGFTLRDSNDFKLDDFYAGSPETFHPFYGPKDDGNVYDPENQLAFQRLIMEHTKGVGVHFMMADGGFSVEGKENIQEILSKQLYLCQCLVALMIVREGGHFVTKLFDLFTPFSVGLVYLLYRCFEKVSVFKPNTSRPANSERYLICEKKKAGVEDVISYLSEANEILLRDDPKDDVTELVPLELLQDADRFHKYICSSNNTLGRKQVVGLLKIAAYCEDPHLFETKQAQMRKECLEHWNLPDQSRIVPKLSKPEDKLRLIVRASVLKHLRDPPTVLTADNVKSSILSQPCDWYAVLCGAGGAGTREDKGMTFYLGMGRTNVYRLVKDTWEWASNIELPPDTFVYAEVVEEMRGQSKNIRRTEALHIIDAYLLGGEDVSQKSLPERYALINKFCQALWKPENSSYHAVRAKELYPLDRDLPLKLQVQPCVLKNNRKTFAHYPDESPYPGRTRSDSQPLFFVPNTVMFLKTTSAPWWRVISKSTGYHYYFNPKTNEGLYDNQRPVSACASFLETFATRLQWHWLEDQSLSIEYLYDNVKQRCPVFPPKN